MDSGRGHSGAVSGQTPQTQVDKIGPKPGGFPILRPDSISFLLSAQNPDGGWGYKKGSSWTEPTAFALLALRAAHPDAPAFRQGIDWLLGTQRRDGGWSPQPAIDQSTWVTSLAILVLADGSHAARMQPARAWLESQTGQESTFLSRVRRMLLGQKLEVGEGTHGWSWFPGTAAWVMPTAIGILALEKIAAHGAAAGLSERIELGREFLLARICRDGGWNHGSSRALGYEANSYAETTGVALLALHGAHSPRLGPALDKAEEQLAHCRSAQGQSWLRMGLMAHGRKPAAAPEAIADEGSVLDRALVALADAAADRGRHIWGAI